jgi:hypothetical protein
MPPLDRAADRPQLSQSARRSRSRAHRSASFPRPRRRRGRGRLLPTTFIGRVAVAGCSGSTSSTSWQGARVQLLQLPDRLMAGEGCSGSTSSTSGPAHGRGRVLGFNFFNFRTGSWQGKGARVQLLQLPDRLMAGEGYSGSYSATSRVAYSEVAERTRDGRPHDLGLIAQIGDAPGTQGRAAAAAMRRPHRKHAMRTISSPSADGGGSAG